MSHPLPQQDPEFVQKTFSSIAGRYDLANHLLSGGLDFIWRSCVSRLVAAARPSRILDLATGSGDLAVALRKACPSAQVIGADFCLPMLGEARRKNVPCLVQADGLALPFREATFDAVTVAFGLRNMASWETALAEMRRVLRPGGLLVLLDFSLPPRGPLREVYRIYLHHVLPRVAGWATGRAAAYEYLGESIEAFPRGSGMAAFIESCGFHCEAPRMMCFGIVSLYAARKARTFASSSTERCG
ncbi:MAG: ubiquinone/menaquinone biosynthesis methyltransferase [Terrimicrobiaceae bacterium]|nr:ubiquinone/menaquinone biosynthesis methyltransferase [Terrimicrobiaceae bacterium]